MWDFHLFRFIYFVPWLFWLLVCMLINVCACCLQRSQRICSPETGVIDQWELPCGFWEMNLDPNTLSSLSNQIIRLQEQYIIVRRLALTRYLLAPLICEINTYPSWDSGRSHFSGNCMWLCSVFIDECQTLI